MIEQFINRLKCLLLGHDWQYYIAPDAERKLHSGWSCWRCGKEKLV